LEELAAVAGMNHRAARALQEFLMSEDEKRPGANDQVGGDGTADEESEADA